MKTVSQRDLNKLIKREGWELTPDSKKAIQEQNISSALSEQVEAITSLTEGVDGIREALEANTAKDYTKVINKLIESLRRIKIEPVTHNEPRNYKFTVKRSPDGLIAEIEATAI